MIRPAAAPQPVGPAPAQPFVRPDGGSTVRKRTASATPCYGKNGLDGSRVRKSWSTIRAPRSPRASIAAQVAVVAFRLRVGGVPVHGWSIGMGIVRCDSEGSPAERGLGGGGGAGGGGWSLLCRPRWDGVSGRRCRGARRCRRGGRAQQRRELERPIHVEEDDLAAVVGQVRVGPSGSSAC